MVAFARSSRPSRPDKGRGKKICVLLCLTAAVFAVLLALPGCGKGGGEKGDDVAISRVPDVVGMTEEEAAEAIEDAGLEVGEISHEISDEVGIGLVMSQDPAPNTKQGEGSAVDLVVSDGPEHAAPDTSTMVEVPSLAHMTPAQAEAALGKLGLKAKRGTDVLAAQLLGATVRVGRVGAQSPAPGAGVAPGVTVTYQVVGSTENVSVPHVVSKYEADAVAALEEAGFIVSVRYEYSSTVGEGKVISQSPSGGGEAGKGSTVTIVVSKGPKPEDGPETVVVPDVSYEYKDGAANQIQSLGLNYAIEYDYNDSVPEGCVIYTNPGAGTEVEVGTTVTMWVSYGPEPTITATVPHVVGTDEASANTMLYEAGFEIYAQYVYDVAPAGMVIDQDPPGWTEAEPGSYVTITISEGPAPEGAEYG